MTNHNKNIVETVDEAENADGVSRRSFIRKASVAGIGITGAILAMSEEAVAQERSSRAQGSSAGSQAVDLEDRIISRASTDAAFRKRLLADPAAVVRAEAGKSMPPNTKVVVVEETANTIYLVLPYVGEAGPGKLSGKDLELAAASWPQLSWFRTCKPKPCKCSSLSVCKAAGG